MPSYTENTESLSIPLDLLNTLYVELREDPEDAAHIGMMLEALMELIEDVWLRQSSHYHSISHEEGGP